MDLVALIGDEIIDCYPYPLTDASDLGSVGGFGTLSGVLAASSIAAGTHLAADRAPARRTTT